MSTKRKVLQGSASNVVRLGLSMMVSLILPPFLVHRLSTAEYGAWVLILQCSAYVGLLDFGLHLPLIQAYLTAPSYSGRFQSQYN